MRAPRVVAVVCTYWPNRRSQVSTIVRDLQASSRPPDRILLVNNAETAYTIPGTDVIHVPWNSRCRGKFLAGFFDPADYYLFLDDDTSVGRTTIETLLTFARRGICTGYLGCWIDERNGSVNTGGRLWPHDATIETPCQTFCGCAMFVAYDALVKLVLFEEWIRLDGRWPHQGDDLVLGLVNNSTVVPLTGDAKFVDLGYQGQAMCYAEEDYYGMRDRFLADVREQLNLHPLPEWT